MANQLFDSSGNPRVDFVWGNMAPQPDYGRDDNWTWFGGGNGDMGWDGTVLKDSDTLDTSYYRYPIQAGENSPAFAVPNFHTMLVTGWSNFPEFIPNYAGDGDAQLEAVIPTLTRRTIAQAEYDLNNVGLNLIVNWHNPSITGITTTGKTVRVFCHDYNAYGGGYAQAWLVGLRVGDKVYVDNDYYNFPDLVTITAVNEDGVDSWIEFEYTEELNLDDSASGTIWPGPDLQNVITVVRSWNAEGNIVNTGRNIYTRALNW